MSLSLCVAFSPHRFRHQEYAVSMKSKISKTILCSSKNSDHRKNNAKDRNSSLWKQFGDKIDPMLCPLSKSEIVSLITERNKARRSRNFELADSILKKLQYNNVYLDDKKKLWRADGESFHQVPQYRKDPNSKPISDREEAYVQIKVQERAEAKFARKFSVADDILDELRFLKNVVINDDTLTWRVTEAFKTVYEFGGKRLHNVPEETLRSIEQLIKERAEAKDNKDYNVADEILDTLQEDYGVRVDDAKKAWFFLPRPREVEDEIAILKQSGTIARNAKDENRVKSKQKSRDASEIPLGISFDDDDDDDDRLPIGISLGTNENREEMPQGVQVNSQDTTCDEMNNIDLNSYTVPQLKDKLREAGLPVSGRKSELVARLSKK